MTAEERATLYAENIADLHKNTLRTFDTKEREDFWQWMVAYIGFGGLESYLEIGSNCGHSLWMIAPFLSYTANAISVDLQNGKSGQPQALQKVCELVGATAIKSNSMTAYDQVKHYAPFQMVMIDADHTYEGVLSDWIIYRKTVKPSGYMVFHDINAKSMGVYKLWHSIKSVFAETWELGNKQGIGIGKVAP